MLFDKQKALKELGIDEKTFDMILKEFINELAEYMRSLKEACDAANFEQIAKIGHTIKGSAANFRLTDLANSAKFLEQIAEERKEKQAIWEQIRLIEKYFEELRNLV